MGKQLWLSLAAALVAGAGYTAVMAAGTGPATHVAAAAPATPAASAAATEKSAAVDVKNTKCIVTKEEVEGDDQTTLEYKGKTYHLCCSMCIKKFNADPEKYIKALEADPAAYGVKK